jgi:long-chain fatty acid transport protein
MRAVRRALAVALLLAPALARANPVDAFGFGSRASAMGGAATADSEDSSANYYNPAGLVRGRSLRIDIGYHYALPRLTLNDADAAVDSSRGFTIGLVAPGAIGPFRFAFGAAVALPDQRLFRARSLAYQTPRFVYYDNRMQRVYLAANLAVQIVPGLYIGGGVTFLSRTQGDVNLAGNVAYTDPDLSSLVAKIDVGLFAVRYPQFGVRWDALPWLSLGVSYRHSFVLQLDQVFRIDGNIGNPGVKPIVENGYFETHTDVSDLFEPWQLTAGASVQVLSRLRVSFDARYARWSEFPAAHLLALSLDLKMLNSAVHVSPARNYPSPGFHDILIPHLGVEVRVHGSDRLAVDVRAGYSYEPTPAPEQTDESNLADSDKHTVTVGAGVELRRLGRVLRGSLALDGYLGATILPTRLNHKTDPRDPVGDFRAGGSIFQAGLTLRTRF